MVNINSNNFRRGPDMLEPHIKYLRGQLNNLFYLINHSQHCHHALSLMAMLRSGCPSIRTDRAARAPPIRVVARSGQSGFALAVARLACCDCLAGPPPLRQFVALPTCCTKSVCYKHMCQVF
jgi:hypothetical protein